MPVTSLKDQSPLAWALITPPEGGDSAIWAQADPKFFRDQLPKIQEDSAEGPFLVINSDTTKQIRKSLRKVFDAVGDKRRVPWHNKLDGYLQRLQHARRAPEPQTEIQVAGQRTWHGASREEYKKFIRLSLSNSRAVGRERVTTVDLRKRLKKKFGLASLPPINIVTDLVAEIHEAERIQEVEAALKKGREEGRKEMQKELGKTKERLAKAQAARAQEALKPEVSETRPECISYQKPSPLNPAEPHPEREKIATQEIATVSFATDPVTNKSYVLLIKKDGTTVAASPHSENRNAVSRLEAWFRHTVALPTNDIAEAPNLSDDKTAGPRPKGSKGYLCPFQNATAT